MTITAEKDIPGNLEVLHGTGAGGAAIFPNVKEFQRAANRYFKDCDARDPPALYSLSGLCLALSRHNKARRTVSIATLRRWFHGEHCPYLTDAVVLACLRIQEQIETDPRYRERGGMSTRAIFLLKQAMLGGYQDRSETRTESRVEICFGANMDAGDFE